MEKFGELKAKFAATGETKYSSKEETALFEAKNSPEYMEFLLKYMGCDPNFVFKFGLTLFHETNNLEVMKLLIKYGGTSSLSVKSRASGCSDVNSIPYDEWEQSEEVKEYLKPFMRFPPLFEILTHKSLEIDDGINLIEESGEKKLLERDICGNTILHLLCKKLCEEDEEFKYYAQLIINKLIDFGYDVKSLKNIHKESPNELYMEDMDVNFEGLKEEEELEKLKMLQIKGEDYFV